MKPACALCGTIIAKRAHQKWRNEFRAVYATNHDWSTPIRLSGIGHAGIHGTPAASLNASDRWNDPANDPDDYPDITVNPLTPHTGDGFWGYGFHAACWVLLTTGFEVELEQLWLLCLSMRVCEPEAMLDWGHDYEGASLRAEDDSSEFEPRPSHYAIGDPLPPVHLRVDPLKLPEFKKVVEEMNSEEEPPKVQGTYGIDGDGFQCLPPELLHEILLLLPSPAVENLRRASPVFSNIGLTETFWASRFQEGGEYHCIFEYSQHRPPPSWRGLYRALRSMRPQSHGLTNRQRIWKLVLFLRDVLGQMADVPCQGGVISSILEPGGSEDTEEWTAVGRGVGGLDKSFKLPCRSLRTRVIRFDAGCQVRQLWVSFIHVGGNSFISGLRFVLQDGKDKAIGYIHPAQEILISFPDGNLTGCDKLSCWQLKLDTMGFKAIAVMIDHGISSWAGDAEKGIPRRTVCNYPQGFSALKIEFDALKMVSFGTAVPGEPDWDLCWPPRPPEEMT